MRRHTGVCVYILLTIIPLICAQLDASAIGIQPLHVDVAVSLGSNEVVEISLSNSSNAQRRIDISLVGVRSLPDGSIVWLSTDGLDGTGESYPYASIGECASIETSSLTIGPHSTDRVRLKIRAPDSLGSKEFAGRVGALWFDIREGASTSLFDSVVRYVTFVLVKFDAVQSLAVELTTSGVRQDADGDLSFPILASNCGNVHISPDWSVIIRDTATGDIVEDLYVPGGTLLPGCPRELVAIWSADSIRDGVFDVEFTARCDGTVLAEESISRICVESGVVVTSDL